MTSTINFTDISFLGMLVLYHIHILASSIYIYIYLFIYSITILKGVLLLVNVSAHISFSLSQLPLPEHLEE